MAAIANRWMLIHVGVLRPEWNKEEFGGGGGRPASFLLPFDKKGSRAGNGSRQPFQVGGHAAGLVRALRLLFGCSSADSDCALGPALGVRQQGDNGELGSS